MAASLAALSRSPQYGAFRLPADPLIGWRLRNTFLEFIDDENTAELECPTMRRALSVDSGMALLRRANFTQWEFTEAAPRHASQFPGTEDKLALPESPASIITKESVHVKASAEIAFNEAGDMKRATRLRPSRRGRRAGGMLQQQATQWMPENTPSPQSNVPSQTMNNFEPSATAPCREGTGVLVLPPKMQQWNMETQQMMNQEQLMQTFQQQQMQSQQVQATKRGSRGKGTNGSVSVQQQQQQQHMMQHQVQQQMHQQQNQSQQRPPEFTVPTERASAPASEQAEDGASSAPSVAAAQQSVAAAAASTPGPESEPVPAERWQSSTSAAASSTAAPRPAVQSVRLMDEDLECPVCLRILVEPKTLCCGHTFCGPCLRSTELQRPVEQDAARCPVCRTQMPQNFSVQALGTNVLLAALVEKFLPDAAARRRAEAAEELELEQRRYAMLRQVTIRLGCGPLGASSRVEAGAGSIVANMATTTGGMEASVAVGMAGASRCPMHAGTRVPIGFYLARAECAFPEGWEPREVSCGTAETTSGEWLVDWVLASRRVGPEARPSARPEAAEEEAAEPSEGGDPSEDASVLPDRGPSELATNEGFPEEANVVLHFQPRFQIAPATVMLRLAHGQATALVDAEFDSRIVHR
eukprot:gnl/TRDRNA2_/TRDRNA2_169306_c5_seq1.p1 gnl/TRDRNA2_/TRDRNA2_169306_c5~~gnl/TRDRNA2_/TRDRNA2_169306_c5_seq1.p1  ORF type:complete len:642 (-),score=134.16 gnl/TRDRNA2_/TRDRNA2_169306_c5_seq1:35-1960(-)